MNKYFVMLNTANGLPMLMTTHDNCVATIYNDEESAIADADNNPLGQAYGYEVYEWTY